MQVLKAENTLQRAETGGKPGGQRLIIKAVVQRVISSIGPLHILSGHFFNLSADNTAAGTPWHTVDSDHRLLCAL
jgi:hypothetical protein